MLNLLIGTIIILEKSIYVAGNNRQALFVYMFHVSHLWRVRR